MGKKLEGNGLWESSRLILPEHRQGLMEQKERMKIKERPILDEQKLQDISQQIDEALHTQNEITIIAYGFLDFVEYTGKILQVEQRKRMVKISDQVFESFWLKFEDILDVRN